MMDHLKNFVEQPSAAFNNMPVCPFAKKARTSGKIEFFVTSLEQKFTLYSRIEQFNAQDFYETLWLINPDCVLTSLETDEISDALSKKYGADLQFFSGHPESNFQMKGIYTRREPYPNIIVQKTSLIERKEAKLKGTRYYD